LKSKTTVVIKTIGRPSLKAAVRSAKREGFRVVVVSDGVKVPSYGADQVVRLGRNWGFYGGMAANVGAAMVSTEFITFLDDDDEFIKGAGDIIRARIDARPDVDVWIAGVRFADPVRLYRNSEVVFESTDLAVTRERGLTPGNVAMPTYRTSIFSKVPFVDALSDAERPLSDLYHVQDCENSGYTVDWFGHILYLVRPGLGGTNGGGR